jgi:hypothetical protein
MSEANETQVESNTPKGDAVQALKNSATLIQECRKLILSGHYSGSKAGRIVQAVGYLEALEENVREQIAAAKKAK